MHRAIQCLAAAAIACTGNLIADPIVFCTSAAPNGNFGTIEDGYGKTVSWTQTNRFSYVIVTARVWGPPEPGGPIKTGRAFLTTRIGPGTTGSDEIASTSFAFPSPETGSNVTLFTGLTLEPGRYFLSIFASTGVGGVGWMGGCETKFVLAEGVVLGGEYDFIGSGAYEPAVEPVDNGQMLLHFTVVAGTNNIPSLDLSEVNTPVTAQDLYLTVVENTPKAFSFPAVDADGDGIGLYLTRIHPGLGTLHAPRLENDLARFVGCYPLTELVFTPPANYVGIGSFGYAVGDGRSVGNSAFVYVDIVPPPLGIARVADSLRLSWAANCPHYEVETAASLDGEWQPVAEAPDLDGEQLFVALTPGGDQQFFRLRRTITP